jgi:hypothetical protein
MADSYLYEGETNFLGGEMWDPDVDQPESDADQSASSSHNPNPSGRAGIPKCAACRRRKIKVFSLSY